MMENKADELRELEFDDNSDVTRVKIKNKFAGLVVIIEWESDHWADEFKNKARITVERDTAYLSPSIRPDADTTGQMTKGVVDDVEDALGGKLDDNR